jgi:secreted trypsin-like serine protease
MRFLVFLGLLACGTQELADVEIVGGKNVPFWWNGPNAKSTVALTSASSLKNGKSFCSGTVVGERTILTAAHCIDDGVSGFIVAGGRDLKKPTFSLPVVNSKPHARWVNRIGSTQGPDFDIGLVFTAEPLPRDIPRVKIGDIANGDWVRAVGYGVSKSRSINDTGILRYVNLDAQGVDPKLCRVATKEARKGTAAGDSGGPLYSRKEEVVGITSYGMERNGTPTGDSYFTLTACYKDWLAKYVQN